MKKILSIVLTFALLFGTCLTLSSCSVPDFVNDLIHIECEFSEEWSGDETHHWHKCTSERCDEIADKAEHTWDDGVITTKATQEADGVKTFTCSGCNQIKEETVVFTGLSKEDWNAAFAKSLFENFTYKEVATTKSNGISVDSEVTYKFTENAAWVQIITAGQTQQSYAPDKASVEQGRNQLIQSIKDMTPYSSYEYDAESKTYKATNPIKIEALDTSTDDVTLTFSEGRLVKIEYSISFVQNGVSITATSVVTITDYDETFVLKP